MNSYFRFAGIFTCVSVAQAHESLAPHTHMFDHQRSDVFVLSLGVLAASGVGLLLFRLFRKRSQQRLSAFPGERISRRIARRFLSV
jgi:hypothetical protein